jgi:guanylate kinase
MLATQQRGQTRMKYTYEQFKEALLSFLDEINNIESAEQIEINSPLDFALGRLEHEVVVKLKSIGVNV